MKRAIIVILFMGLINYNFAASSSKKSKTKISSSQRHAALNTAKKYLSQAKKYSRYANNPAYAEKMRKYIAGAEGGLLCAPTHLLEPEVPLDNIEAYLDECRKYTP